MSTKERFDQTTFERLLEIHGAHLERWPEELRDRAGEAVVRFEAGHEDQIRFHIWLQFQCDRQLAEAQRRAKAAGMRIGLYLDFAVGVSPDGAETWADPALTVREARVGSPPDMFNSDGQDWGLAPLSPRALAERHYAPLSAAYRALMEHAGAIRIDHAMGLARLWWIPEGGKSSGGGYVRYPLGAMVDALARVSQDTDCLVIGEDLGTVPEGFRETMAESQILAYKVLYFERWKDGLFKAAGEYPPTSLACISTHDLATLAGWWHGSDVRLRAETGRQTAEHTERDLNERARDRRMRPNRKSSESSSTGRGAIQSTRSISHPTIANASRRTSPVERMPCASPRARHLATVGSGASTSGAAVARSSSTFSAY